MAINRTSPKKGKVVDIPDATITIGTPTAGAGQASVAFTVATTPATGGPVQKYTAVSNPGSFTGDATTSPVVVTGLTNGTAYTFQVAAANATGRGPLSSASTSVTPVDPASFVSIATQTVGSGGASSVTFSSIPSTYKHLQIRAIGRTNRANVEDGLYIRFNNDTGGNYNAHMLWGNGASTGSALATTTTDTKIETYGMPGNNATSGIFGVAVIDILDYANSNKKKVTQTLTGDDRNGSGWVELNSGLWMSSSTITDITLFAIGSWLQYSSFALYGIKG